MDTIARVRRAFHVQGWSVKKITRELNVSRNTVRKIPALWSKCHKIPMKADAIS